MELSATGLSVEAQVGPSPGLQLMMKADIKNAFIDATL